MLNYSFNISIITSSNRDSTYLDRPFTERTPGRLLLLSCRLQRLLRLLGSHTAKSDGDVQRRLQTGLKVHPVLLFEPAGRQRQSVPRLHPQHVGDDTPVELQAGLFPGTPGDMGETSGGVRVLPGPLKLTNTRMIVSDS